MGRDHPPRRPGPGPAPGRHDVVDECHNFLHLPIGVDDALAESRGYRVSWVLAHQHQAQLPPEVREALDANARNKIYFTPHPPTPTAWSATSPTTSPNTTSPDGPRSPWPPGSSPAESTRAPAP